MFSAVKVQLIKVVDHIPGLRSRRNVMAETPEFIAVDTFAHRYVDEKVLLDALVDLGFDRKDIQLKLTENNGFDAKIPRKVTEKERDAIHKKFLEAAYAKRGVPVGNDEEED